MRTNLSQLDWTFFRKTEKIVVAYRHLNIQTPQHPQFGGIQATQQLRRRHTLQRLPTSKEGLGYEEEILLVIHFCGLFVNLSADAEECDILFAFLEGQVRGLIGDDYIFINHIAYFAWAFEERGGRLDGGVHDRSGFGRNVWAIMEFASSTRDSRNVSCKWRFETVRKQRCETVKRKQRFAAHQIQQGCRSYTMLRLS